MNYSAFSNSLMKKVHVIFTCISVIRRVLSMLFVCFMFDIQGDVLP